MIRELWSCLLLCSCSERNFHRRHTKAVGAFFIGLNEQSLYEHWSCSAPCRWSNTGWWLAV